MAGAKEHPSTAMGVQYVMAQGYSVTEAARLVSVHRTTLSRAVSRFRRKNGKKRVDRA